MAYFAYQGNDEDCGFAALKMLLATLERERAYLDLEKPEGRKGRFSFRELVGIAGEHGVKLVSYRYERKFDLVMSARTPFLASIDSNGENHLVMIRRFNSSRLTVHDPSLGVVRMSLEEFLARWNGCTLEPEAVKRTKYVPPRKRVLPWALSFFGYVLSVFAVAVLLVGFYFLGSEDNIYLPIVCLSAFAITELVEKWYLFKVLKYFDGKYLAKVCAGDGRNFERRYREYLDFKKSLFSGGKRFFLAFLMAGSIGWILCLNDWRNAFFLAFFGLAVFLERLIFGRRDELRNGAMIEGEAALLGGRENETVRLERLQALNGLTYRYVFDLSLRKFAYLVLLLVASVGLMLFSGIFSANFVLLNFFIYYFFIENLQTIAAYGSERRRYARLKARFVDAYL